MRGEGGSLVTSKLKQHTHTYTNPRPGHYLTHAHSHITLGVAAMDSCFALIRAHQHGIAVVKDRGKPVFNRPFPTEASPLSASSTQHMWELLAGNQTVVLP